MEVCILIFRAPREARFPQGPNLLPAPALPRRLRRPLPVSALSVHLPLPTELRCLLGVQQLLAWASARFLFLRSGPALPPDLQARICHLLADGPPARLTAPHTQCVFPAQPVVFPPRLAPHPSVAPSATLVAPARNLRISFESLPLTKTVSLPLDPVDSAP